MHLALTPGQFRNRTVDSLNSKEEVMRKLNPPGFEVPNEPEHPLGTWDVASGGQAFVWGWVVRTSAKYLAKGDRFVARSGKFQKQNEARRK